MLVFADSARFLRISRFCALCFRGNLAHFRLFSTLRKPRAPQSVGGFGPLCGLCPVRRLLPLACSLRPVCPCGRRMACARLACVHGRACALLRACSGAFCFHGRWPRRPVPGGSARRSPRAAAFRAFTVASARALPACEKARQCGCSGVLRKKGPPLRTAESRGDRLRLPPCAISQPDCTTLWSGHGGTLLL